jgi:hypothetical protein
LPNILLNCVYLHFKEKLKERRLKADMERELEEKDRILNELVAREKEVCIIFVLRYAPSYY